MKLADLAILNFSAVTDHEAGEVVAMLNRQVQDDFLPIWGRGYLCRLHSSRWKRKLGRIRGEAVIYLLDRSRINEVLEFHSVLGDDLPTGFVFTDLGDWTVTLAHEVLELIVDPHAKSASTTGTI